MLPTMEISNDIDHVRWLINKQLFDGTWELKEDEVKMLTEGGTLEKFQSNIINNEIVITTAIAISILESKHSDQQDLWHAVVSKARQQLINFGLTQDQVELLIKEIKNKL